MKKPNLLFNLLLRPIVGSQIRPDLEMLIKQAGFSQRIQSQLSLADFSLILEVTIRNLSTPRGTRINKIVRRADFQFEVFRLFPSTVTNINWQLCVAWHKSNR